MLAISLGFGPLAHETLFDLIRMNLSDDVYNRV